MPFAVRAVHRAVGAPPADEAPTRASAILTDAATAAVRTIVFAPVSPEAIHASIQTVTARLIAGIDASFRTRHVAVGAPPTNVAASATVTGFLVTASEAVGTAVLAERSPQTRIAAVAGARAYVAGVITAGATVVTEHAPE